MHTQDLTIGRALDTSVGPTFLAVSPTDLRGAFGDAVRSSFGGQAASAIRTYHRGRSTAVIHEVDVPDLAVEIPELGGRLVPRVWARNANDGTTALTVGVGLFRLLCLNGLYVGVSAFATRIRHTDSARTHEALDLLPAAFTKATGHVASGELVSLCLDACDEQVLDPLAILAQLPGMTTQGRDRAISSICLGRGRAEDDVRTAWGLYQLANESNRRTSRSAFAVADRDMGMLEGIQVLAADQRSAVLMANVG